MPQDESLYCALYTNAKIMRCIAPPLTPAKAQAAFKRCLQLNQAKKPYFLTWCIINNHHKQSIGIETLVLDKLNQSAEIGIMLLRHANGKLMPEEAMGALMEYAFTQLNLTTIKAKFSAKNLATKRFTKKLGFSFNTERRNSIKEPIHCYFEHRHWQQKLIKHIF